jgi:hypothetical protein
MEKANELEKEEVSEFELAFLRERVKIARELKKAGYCPYRFSVSSGGSISIDAKRFIPNYDNIFFDGMVKRLADLEESAKGGRQG